LKNLCLIPTKVNSMEKGQQFTHEKYGPLTVQGKAYSRLGNKVLWVVVDQNGKKMNMEEAELAELIEKSEEKERKEVEKEEIKRQKEIEKEQKPMELTKIAEAIRFQKGDPGVDADEERVIQAVIPQVLAQIRLPKDGEPGKDSDVEEVITKLLPLVMAEMPKPDKPKEIDIPALISKIMARIRIPKDGEPGKNGKPGKNGSPDSPEEIKDKLQSLKGDNRLDARAIKNLPRSLGGSSVGGVSRLQDLSDVTLSSPTNNQSLTYDSASGKWVNETVSGGSGGHIIQDEGTSLTARANINFVGDGVTVTDDSGNDATIVTISAAAPGSGITRTVTVSSGNFTAGSSASVDYEYLIAGAHTTTLPTAVGNSNKYTFKNNHSANVTINPAGGQTIDGAATLQLGPEEAIDLTSDNTSNWNIS